MPKIEVILWAESEAEAREFIDLVGDKAEYSIRRAYVAKKSAGKRDVGFKYQDGVYFPYDLRIGATLAESIVAPRFVTDLVQWCTPDVILSSESKALIAVETTYHILTFNNVAQRIPHQVRSASLGVPSVIFQKVDYSLTTELTWFAKTFVKATKIYGTPCLALMFDEPGYSKARDQLIDLVNSAVKESKEFDSVAELILKRMEEIASLFDVESLLHTKRNRPRAWLKQDKRTVTVSIGVKDNCALTGIPGYGCQGDDKTKAAFRKNLKSRGPDVKGCMWLSKGTGGMDPYSGLVKMAEILLCLDD